MFVMSVLPPYSYGNVGVNVQSHKALKLKTLSSELFEH